MALDYFFDWNELTGHMVCVLEDTNSNQVFMGEAYCSEEDVDMMSRRTGEHIAYSRATIKYYKNEVKNYKEQLKGLNNLYYSVNLSKHYDRKGYMEHMLYRQINIIKNKIQDTKQKISMIEDSLKEYIIEKDKIYKQIRAKQQQ